MVIIIFFLTGRGSIKISLLSSFLIDLACHLFLVELAWATSNQKCLA